jgi:uncharacterized protein YbjT (DUF2867 family)
MITILGATGRTGGGAARRLLEAGERVRALGRSAEGLKALADRGAETRSGDAADAAFLTEALRGAEAAYVLVPPNPVSPDYPAEQARTVEAVARAVADSGVPRVVMLSSIGADRPEGTGPILGLRRLEERLKATPGVHVLALRPGYFFENHLGTIGLIRHQGINGAAVDPDLAIAAVATRDIAAAAAEALAARDFTGFAVRELQGPRNLSMREATRIIGAAIGKPDLPYVQFGYDDLKGALVRMGLSESMAGLYAEMSRAFNEGRIRATEPRGPRNTTATRFETFVEDTYLPAYRAA